MYKLQLTSKFKKDFKKCPSSELQEKALEELNQIASNPFKNVKKLEGVKEGIYRKRIGNFRIRFDVVQKTKEIILYSFKHRKEIYKK